MVEIKPIAKWGFGMAPISQRMQLRYDAAVQTALDAMDGNLTFNEIPLDDISELKGMFNRCLRQDQWDWFTVYTELEEPPRKNMRRIAGELKLFRRAISSHDAPTFERVKRALVDSNLLQYLHTYQRDVSSHTCEPKAGWIYILSTREQPDVLKIGMTRRTVSERVKAINSATGVLIPFSARRVFRVVDAARAEAGIFEALASYRIRLDREFFKISFADAVAAIEAYLETSQMRSRMHGIVLWYDVEKGYGFISVPDSQDVFLHASQVQPSLIQEIKPGVSVGFGLGRRPQGPFAFDVSPKVEECS